MFVQLWQKCPCVKGERKCSLKCFRLNSAQAIAQGFSPNHKSVFFFFSKRQARQWWNRICGWFDWSCVFVSLCGVCGWLLKLNGRDVLFFSGYWVHRRLFCVGLISLFACSLLWRMWWRTPQPLCAFPCLDAFVHWQAWCENPLT